MLTFSSFYHKITLFENIYGIKLITLISMYHLKPLVSLQVQLKLKCKCTDTPLRKILSRNRDHTITRRSQQRNEGEPFDLSQLVILFVVLIPDCFYINIRMEDSSKEKGVIAHSKYNPSIYLLFVVCDTCLTSRHDLASLPLRCWSSPVFHLIRRKV